MAGGLGGEQVALQYANSDAPLLFQLHAKGMCMGVHPTPLTLRPQTPNPKPHKLNSKPYTLNPDPYTLNPKPHTLSPTLTPTL